MAGSLIQKNEDRIPASIVEIIVRAMPQAGDDTVADIRARMQTRQNKVLRHD
jgi:hypothetical protein